MHTKKEDRNTRRQFNRNAQQQDSYNGITDNQPDEDISSNQLYSDEYVDNEDKYSQFPKRAVESEYASQQTEDEPTVMSRQAKYNKKSKNTDFEDVQQEHMEGNQLDDVGVVEPQIDPKELKAQRKREKQKYVLRKRKEKSI